MTILGPLPLLFFGSLIPTAPHPLPTHDITSADLGVVSFTSRMDFGHSTIIIR